MKLSCTSLFIAVGLAVTSEAASVHPQVIVEGVVRSVMRDSIDVRWYHAELAMPSNTVDVAIPANVMSYRDLRRLLDAEIRVSGKQLEVLPIGALHRYSSIAADAPITVLKPPPSDPFTAPMFTITNINHRQRIAGSVIATRRGRILIRRKNSRYAHDVLLAEEAEDSLPPVGARITAVGFIKKAMRRILVCEALVRVDQHPSDEGEEVPLEIKECERLFTTTNGAGILDWDLNGRLVQLSGVAVSTHEDPDDPILLKCGKQTIRIDMAVPEGYPRIPAGATLDVVGICRLEFEDYPSDTLIPRFRGFTIFPRSAAEVKVLALPPWWTPARLLMVIVILVGCIIAVLIWNRTLKTLSERRGKELYLEQTDHALAELKVEERTRLAVEIHDTLSQILTGVSLQIDAAISVGKDGFAAAEKYLDTARRMLASCRHELRCCIWDLRSRTFEEKDMTEAVERTIAPHAGAANVSVRFNVPRAAFSDSTAHVALRIIRELVVNAMRHGHAAHIWIAGEFHDGTIRFSVRDDGIGFDPESVQGPAQGHFGLQGVRERLAAISGSIEVKSGNGSGTKVTVSFPAEKEEP